MPERKPKRLEWSRRAEDDLFRIWRFIAEDNPAAADRVFGKLLATARLLEQQPLLGRKGQRPGTRELPVATLRFTIIYRLGATTVRIGRILHQSRKYP